jgi:glutamate synthase (NADPH) small chain
VFLGLGTYTYVKGGFPGEDLPGVHEALPFLVSNARRVMGASRRPAKFVSMAGKRVVVLGGGDTGMDCVRTAVRQGASHVICAYRRDERTCRARAARCATRARKASSSCSTCSRSRSWAASADRREGRRDAPRRAGPRWAASARARPGSERIIPADAVIIAFGFRPDPPAWLTGAGVETWPDGRLRVDAAGRYPFQTTHAKIFAGGDNVRGSDLVVTAVFEGREAARGILAYLGV